MRRDRVRIARFTLEGVGEGVTRLTVSDVGDDRSWRSGLGFVMVFLARRLVSSTHRVTDELPKHETRPLSDLGT